jgi:ceramide glucosyltransferase
MSSPIGTDIAMTYSIWLATAFCLLATLVHLASVLVAIVRCRPSRPLAPANGAPPVSIIRPVCGIDNFVEDTLRSTFELDHPSYEILFCVAHAGDPVVPIVHAVMAAHPATPARLLVGDERVSANPKLNNCVKGWKAAAHECIIMADSNVLMPRDYIQRLLAAWAPGCGLVCAPPIGSRPGNFWAELECAFLNTYQARWQYFADTLGRGFAQGKTMAWRRSDLERAGGIRALGAELAEDAAATKLVRAGGRRVRLVDAPFAQPLGHRRLTEVWRRQTRWARLRRACFPGYFLPELISGSLFPLLAAAYAAHAAGWSATAGVVGLAALWYGAEIALARAAHWPLPPLYPLHALLRDLLLPCLWLDGLFGTGFVWRGHAMSVADGAAASAGK